MMTIRHVCGNWNR